LLCRGGGPAFGLPSSHNQYETLQSYSWPKDHAPILIWQDIVFRPGRLTSIVEVKRIQGPIFNSKEAAD
jgi:hypothetical protein